jgi:phi13 family phage major tail protein
MYPVWAPLATHTDGSMPTYSAGTVIQEARNATVNREYANNPLYGDDRIVDDDNGMTGLTISFESTGLSDADRKILLGEEDYGTSGVSGQWVSDNETPWGGFGYIRKMRDNGVKKFEAWWTLKIKFQEESMATTTKEGSIQWNTPTLNGRGAGLYVDSSDKLRYQLHKTFDTIASAKAWLNGLAGITG